MHVDRRLTEPGGPQGRWAPSQPLSTDTGTLPTHEQAREGRVSSRPTSKAFLTIEPNNEAGLGSGSLCRNTAGPGEVASPVWAQGKR